jgi:hypothetical protein
MNANAIHPEDLRGNPALRRVNSINVSTGSIQGRSLQRPNLPPPNPALGDSMRNRRWADRERETYYQLQQAPMPHQFTEGRPHPEYGGGEGNQLTQWMPQGPPTGFNARGLTQAHIDAGGRGPTAYADPRSPTAHTIRPTYAYNRVVGVPRSPTMYAGPGTWPYQYYPGASNTYIPSYEATGILIKYTRNPTYFRINRYVKELTVKEDMGYYLTLDPDQPYRVVNINDYLWEDSADAPGGRQERQGFAFQPYRTTRYCFAFSLGRKGVQQAVWAVVAEHAAMQAAKSMTVRTMIVVNLINSTANWTGPGSTNTSAVGGKWSTQGTSNTNAVPYLQNDLNTALIAIEQASGGIVTDEEALQFTMNPVEGRGVSASDEYRGYIKGSPDALAAITDQRNPNRKYGLAPFIYGLRLVIENAIVVTTPKSANITPPLNAQARSYVWPSAIAAITSRPQGIVAPEVQTLDFSTVALRFYENQTVETKSDPDERREVGRVVEDFCASLQAPQTGYLFTGAS